jgi:hypothetical protein
MAKQLAGIRADTAAVRKAIKFMRLILEKRDNDYVVSLRKGKKVVELEFLF